MKPLPSLLSLLGVQPGEGRPVAYVFLLFFGLGLARTLTRNSAYTFFLLEFDGASLPYVYIGASLVVTLTMLLYLRFSGRFSYLAQVMSMLGLMLGVQLLLRLAISMNDGRWIALALPIWYEGLVVLIALVAWGVAEQLFHVRQSKRLFGLIGSGLSLAFIVGGLMTQPLVRWLGTANLLLVAAGAILFATLIVLGVRQQLPATVRSQAAPAKQQLASLRALLRQRYVGLMFALIAFSALAFYFVDNIFYERVGAQFPDEAQLAAFMGFYSIVTGVLTLLSGVVITGPLLNRFGVWAGALASPLAQAFCLLAFVVIGSLWGAVPALFWLAFLAKLIYYAVGAIDRPTRTIFYQPLPPAVRVQMQTATEGILEPIIIGLVGLIILLLTRVLGFTVVGVAYMALAILAGWMVAALAVGSAYPAMLMKALLRRQLGNGDLAVGLTLTDGATRTVLQRGLQSPHEDVVLYTLDRLVELTEPALPELLAGLLAHPARRVQQRALACIEQLGLRALMPTVQQQLALESSPHLRGALLRTLAALADDQTLERIATYLDDPELAVRQGAMIGLLRYGGLDGILSAGDHLLRQLNSADPQARIAAAQVLGEVGVSHYYQPVVALLKDDDPAVQRAALATVAQLRTPQLWPLVIEKLASPPLARPAFAALVAGGEDALPAISRVLMQPAPDPHLLLRLSQVCGRSRSPQAIPLLQDKITVTDAVVRSQVLRALSRCRYEAMGADAITVKAQMEVEAGDAAWTLAAWVDLAGVEGAALLCAALQSEVEQQRARLLRLLAFLVDPQAVRQAQKTLEAPRVSTEQRAFALEVLDVVTTQEQKTLLFPLLEELTPPQRLQRLTGRFPQSTLTPAARLHDLLAARERLQPWTQACAVDAVGKLGLVELAPLLDSLLDPLQPVIQETIARVRFSFGQAQLLTGKAAPAHCGNPQTNSLSGETTMLSTIERVIILKTVSIFAQVPDATLAEIAAIVEEVAVAEHERIFAKGDVGTAMYIIVAGAVRIHDGEQIFNRLGEREVFGEMALLDAEPRSASVTAEEETLLLRLEQEAFFELMEDHGAIARGIIQVLSQRLRARTEDLRRK